MSPSFTVTASSFCIFHCTSLIISQRNGGLPECNLSDKCPADSSFLQPAAISSLTAGGGQAPAPTGMLSSPKGAQRENWVDKEFIFFFFQDSSGPACVPKLACWWTYLCKKARAAAWCTSLATVGNHILVIFRWPLEDRVHEPRAENLCGLSWNQRDLSKSYAEKSQELESWSQLVMAHCWLVLFRQCWPTLQWSPADARQSFPAMLPSAVPPAWVLGRALTSNTTDWLVTAETSCNLTVRKSNY